MLADTSGPSSLSSPAGAPDSALWAAFLLAFSAFLASFFFWFSDFSPSALAGVLFSFPF